MQPLQQTLRAFWNSKRFVLLFIFALLFANLIYYIVDRAARKQVLFNSQSQHLKVYTIFLQALDRVRREVTTAPESSSAAYWAALRETRKGFPSYKVNLLVSGSVDDEGDHRILETFKNRPRGWSLTDHRDGWSRSFYVLPTKNVATLQVVSYVRDEISNWQTTAVYLGSYGFIIFLFFGWFWSRALHSTVQGQEVSEHVLKKIKDIKQVVLEMQTTIESLQSLVLDLDLTESVETKRAIQALEEITAQIRLLAINGSLEAARSMDDFRVFHIIMQEINHYALNARQCVNKLSYQESDQSLDAIKDKMKELQNLVQNNFTHFRAS